MFITGSDALWKIILRPLEKDLEVAKSLMRYNDATTGDKSKQQHRINLIMNSE